MGLHGRTLFWITERQMTFKQTRKGESSLPFNNVLEPWHEGGSQVAVLEEDPAALQDLSLGDELLRLGPLATPKGDQIHVECAASHLTRKPHQLRRRVNTW